MTLTDFEPRHLDGVWEIEKECFAHPWSREDLAAQIENEQSHFAVAVDEDGTVAGYAGVQIICGEGYITNVAVLPRYRRKGIAKALMLKIMENEMDFLTLEVRKSNVPAIKLYEKLGFYKVGERRNFYSDPEEDALLYTCFFDK